jgi:hypothetical protein
MFIISKKSLDIGNIKTVYLIFTLITLSLFGFLVVSPQFIPSWEIVPKVIVGLIYISNIILLYIIIKRSQKYFFKHFAKKLALRLTILISILSVFTILFLFIGTSLGFGQGFLGASYVKEFNYPKRHTSIYIYDAGFLDPVTSIKVRRGFFPFMKDLKTMNGWIPYGIKVSHNKDAAQLVFQTDTLKISLETGKLISN